MDFEDEIFELILIQCLLWVCTCLLEQIW
jgi:hypothetical protein